MGTRVRWLGMTEWRCFAAKRRGNLTLIGAGWGLLGSLQVGGSF